MKIKWILRQFAIMLNIAINLDLTDLFIIIHCEERVILAVIGHFLVGSKIMSCYF